MYFSPDHWKSNLFVAEAHLYFGLACMTPFATILLNTLILNYDLINRIFLTKIGKVSFSLSVVLAYFGWEYLIRRTFISIYRLESNRRV
jgi:hypothetical protein